MRATASVRRGWIIRLGQHVTVPAEGGQVQDILVDEIDMRAPLGLKFVAGELLCTRPYKSMFDEQEVVRQQAA